MDRLEKAYERLRNKDAANKIIADLDLSREESELLKIAARLMKEPEISFSTWERQQLYGKISAKIGINSFSLTFKKRFVFALAVLLIFGSSVIALATASSTPESPLYPIKRAYYAFAARLKLRTFKENEAVRREIIKKEIRDYEKALATYEKHGNRKKAKILKKVIMKKRIEIKEIIKHQHLKKLRRKGKPYLPTQNKNMPPLKEPEKRFNSDTIPKIDRKHNNIQSPSELEEDSNEIREKTSGKD
jgi:hypothetical protein